jgi:hypothetical protein
MTYCQGEKGGQSPLSSIHYKKQNTPLYTKKILEKFLENRNIYIIMKRTIKLTERDLSRIVKRVMNEQDEELAPADDNEYLENLKDIFQMYVNRYCKNSDDFDNMVDVFYEGYESVINNMTDEDKNKFERFIEGVYSRLPTYGDNDMYDDLTDDNDY